MQGGGVQTIFLHKDIKKRLKLFLHRHSQIILVLPYIAFRQISFRTIIILQTLFFHISLLYIYVLRLL